MRACTVRRRRRRLQFAKMMLVMVYGYGYYYGYGVWSMDVGFGRICMVRVRRCVMAASASATIEQQR